MPWDKTKSPGHHFFSFIALFHFFCQCSDSLCIAEQMELYVVAHGMGLSYFLLAIQVIVLILLLAEKKWKRGNLEI